MRMGKRATLFVAATVLVAVLACLPWSGWLVRLQLRVASGGPLPNWASGHNPTAEGRERERQTAAAHPGDFPLQLAAAFQSRPGIFPESGSGIEKVDTTGETQNTKAARSLWGQRDRFASNPSLYANTLRLLTSDAVRIRRETETAELEPKSATKAPVYGSIGSRPQNTAEYLAWFDEAAATGERLEPTNGYFPAMRAIGLFAAHRDDEALVALHRAAGKTEWNEYSQDDVRGNWRLMTLTYDEPGSFARLGQAASLLFPHYAPLRNAARLATVQAMHREQSGKTQGGFGVRRDVARLGALMRTRAAFVIGTCVGSSIGTTAQARPGGVPALARPAHLTDAVRNDQIQEAYCAYLRQIGQPQEIEFVRAEASATERLTLIRKQIGERDIFSSGSLLPLAGMWTAGSAILLSAAVTLLFGAACFRLQRSPLLTHRLAPACVLTLSFLLLGGVLAVLIPQIVSPWKQWLELFTGIAAYDEGTPETTMSTWETVRLFLPFGFGMLMLAVPLLLVGTAAKRSRKQAAPRAVGFVRSYASLALPTASILLIGYAAVACVTLRMEASKRSEVEQTLTNENLYLADIAHQTLPGFSAGQTVTAAVGGSSASPVPGSNK